MENASPHYSLELGGMAEFYGNQGKKSRCVYTVIINMFPFTCYFLKHFPVEDHGDFCSVKKHLNYFYRGDAFTGDTGKVKSNVERI